MNDATRHAAEALVRDAWNGRHADVDERDDGAVGGCQVSPTDVSIA